MLRLYMVYKQLPGTKLITMWGVSKIQNKNVVRIKHFFTSTLRTLFGTCYTVFIRMYILMPRLKILVFLPTLG